MGKSMMLEGYNIFILGTTKFDNPYESATYTIAKYLAQRNSVFYIENPFTWKDYIKYRGTAEIKKRKSRFSTKSNGILDTDIEGLKIVITPPLLSLNFLPENWIYRQLLKYNERIIARRIDTIIKERNIPNFIYINSFNFHYPNISDYFNPLLKVYHCVDPLIIPFDQKHGFVSEPILMVKSNMVVCTSQQLQREKTRWNSNSYFIPNAADLAHSKKALDGNLPVHRSLDGFKKPIIGFFGNIERRMDFDLLHTVTTTHADKTFVFAGPYDRQYLPDWFLKASNIKLTGRLPYEDMPAILKGFDVTIIPFKKDDVSATIFPLKLFEYLGAGKPVVCTNFNEDLPKFTGDTVRFCVDADSFSEAIHEELINNSPLKLSERLKVAQENTWQKRVDEFSELMYSHIKR